MVTNSREARQLLDAYQTTRDTIRASQRPGDAVHVLETWPKSTISLSLGNAFNELMALPQGFHISPGLCYWQQATASWFCCRPALFVTQKRPAVATVVQL